MTYDITTEEKLIETRSNFENFSFEDASIIKGFHVTTSANQCKDILSRGIEPLADVLKNSNSEMSQFLRNYALSFDIDESAVIRNGKSCSLNVYPYGRISHLLKRKVYAFLYCEDVKSYGVVHRYPEILNEMVKNAILPSSSLNSWEESRKAYKISFAVPCDYIDTSYLQINKATMGEYLLKQITNLKISDTTNCEIVFNKIPKEFITNIETIDQD